MICAYSHIAKAQTIIIDSTFANDVIIQPFGSNDTLYSLKISGSLTLNSDTSLVRVVVGNEDSLEYMVYESYPLISEDYSFSFTNKSDETSYLNTFFPKYLKVYLINASISIDSLSDWSSNQDNLDSLQIVSKHLSDLQKVNSMNQILSSRGAKWVAGLTNRVDLFFMDKKNIYRSPKFDLKGWDYYESGIFSFPCYNYFSGDNSIYVDHFDWREKHNANINNPSSPYYNAILGWLTDVRDQEECWSCSAFGTIASAEAMANLYFNQHVDYDLSEHQVYYCCGGVCLPDPNNGPFVYPSQALNFIASTPTFNESCVPYPGNDEDCHTSCVGGQTLQYSITTSGRYGVYYNYADNIKSALITKGPLVMEIQINPDVSHVMSLIGFDTDPDSKIITWHFKDSEGNGKISHYELCADIIVTTNYIKTPINIVEGPSYDVIPRDYDKDGYYNWGIGDKPDIPDECDPELLEDSHDDNNRIGPYDDFFYGKPIKPEMKVVYDKSPFEQIEITNGGILVFDGSITQSQSFQLLVSNNGSAQLNFDPDNFNSPFAKIEISGQNSNSFTYDDKMQNYICMQGAEESFSILYDGSCTGSAECFVTIHLDELDMDDFTFAIIYADCNKVPANITISDVQIWDDWRVITDNYKIEHGGKLTITGYVGISDQVDFVVDKRGELIIDGGTLTNACSDTWKGIDVLGDASLSQYPISNQGYLNIINGGCIEHAEAGVQLTRLFNGVPSSNRNGGVIRCDSALFKNNEADVIFYSYNNFDPNTLVKAPNRSYFYNTQFLNDQICEKDIHVVLQNVDGIYFKGCSFINNVDKNLQNCQTFFRGVGIYSFNSGFYVDEYCLDDLVPCGNTRQCLFENLHYGIYALNAEFNEIVSIDTAIFYNTYRGVYMNLIAYPEIIRNQFIYDEDYQIETTYEETYGLDLEHCRSFIVEENVFSNSSTIANMVGLQVLNGGPYSHEIYNNSFTGLPTGITAAGENRNGEGTEGLCLKCNDFSDCDFDIYITPVGGVNPDFLGIATNQGQLGSMAPPGVNPNAMAAGNTFSEIQVTEYNYYNDPDLDQLHYIHHPDQAIIKLRPSYYNNVLPEEDPNVIYLKEVSCPSSLGGGIDILFEKNTIATEALQIAAYQDTLNQFVDGGDTEYMNLGVQTSFPDEALEVRQELLDESPYLSDTVMKSAIYQENVLPNAMVRDVLVANPQSVKSAEVINALDDRFVPMPDYMMAEIMAGLNISGAKEILERIIAKHATHRAKSLSKLIHHYKNDTINTYATDSLIALLQNEQNLDARYQLAFMYLNIEDSLLGVNILNNIPIEFSLDNNQQLLHSLYEDLFDVLLDIQADTLGLDSIQIQTLQDISAHQCKFPGIYARNILITNNLTNYNEPIYLPDNLKSSPTWEYKKPPDETIGSLLKVYPNPAGSYFIVEYDIREFEGNANLIISNISGSYISSYHIKDKQNQRIIATKAYPAGMYLIQLFINSEHKESHKILIVK